MSALTMPTAGRRGLLGAAAALLAGAAAAPDGLAAGTPDADLIAACQAFDLIERRIRAYVGDTGGDGAAPIGTDDEADRVIEPLKDRQRHLLRTIVASQAATLKGVAARAHTLTLWAPDLAEDDGDGDYVDRQMLAALLRDLLALRDGRTPEPPASAAPAHADVELIAAVAGLERHHASLEKYEAMSANECWTSGGHFERVHDAWWDTARRVESLPATTRQGIRAKARALQITLQSCVLTRPDFSLDDAAHHERLAYKLAAEILALD